MEFYLIACSHLLSCRSIGMAAGPVPWTAIYQYCSVIGFDDWEGMTNIVGLVVHGLDKHHESTAK